MLRHLPLLRPIGLALLACLPLAGSLPAAAPAPAPQDGNEFNRLSKDQAKLAEQVRRLERLLETLEQREREKGDDARAELLRNARERLQGLDGSADLATAIETVAESLSEMRSGAALEAQAQLVEELQSLLEFLLQEHLDQQLQDMLEAARLRSERLGALVEQQTELLRQLQQLKKEQAQDPSQAGENEASEAGAEQPGEPSESSESESESGEAEAAESESSSNESNESNESSESKAPGESAESAESAPSESGESPQEQAPRDAEELAERQEELREQIEQMLQESAAGSAQQNLEQAKQQSRQAEQELREQDLEEAQERMEQALQELKEAQQRAEEQQDQAEQRDQLEDLIQFLAEAQALLDRHQLVLKPLAEFIDEAGGRRPSRRDHVRLRGWAEDEQALSDDTAALLVEVDVGGADMFPFLLQVLADDHARLARDLGPGRYRATQSQLELADGLRARWQELIDAVKTEMERVRQQLEQPGGGGGGGEQDPEEEQRRALVGFAEELQLLKRVQEQLRQQLERYLLRREALAESGLELDQDDLDEIDRLIERQAELREVYESMLNRLREQDQGGGPAEEGA